MRNFIFQAFETEGHNGFCNAKGFRQFPFEMHKVLPGLQLRESLFDAGQKEARGEQKLGSPFVRLPFQEAILVWTGALKQLKDFAGPSRWSVTWISSWPQVKLFSRQERFPLSRIISGPPSVERQEIPFSPGVLKGGNPRARFGRFSHKEMRSKGPFFSEILH